MPALRMRAPRTPASRMPAPRMPAPRMPARRMPAPRMPAPRIPSPRRALPLAALCLLLTCGAPARAAALDDVAPSGGRAAVGEGGAVGEGVANDSVANIKDDVAPSGGRAAVGEGGAVGKGVAIDSVANIKDDVAMIGDALLNDDVASLLKRIEALERQVSLRHPRTLEGEEPIKNSMLLRAIKDAFARWGTSKCSDNGGPLFLVLGQINQRMAEIGAELKVSKAETTAEFQIFKAQTANRFQALKAQITIGIDTLQNSDSQQDHAIHDVQEKDKHQDQAIHDFYENDKQQDQTIHDVQEKDSQQDQTIHDVIEKDKQQVQAIHDVQEKDKQQDQIIHDVIEKDKQQDQIILDVIEKDKQQDQAMEDVEGSDGRQEQAIQDARASAFVHWGSATCSNSSSLVYSGVVGGGHHSSTGAPTNHVCLTLSPNLSQRAVPTHSAYLYGAEYETEDSRQNKDPVCAVCRAAFSTTVMIPGTDTCTPGWHRHYSGFLMAGKYDQIAGSELICVDSGMQSRLGSDASQHGKMLYFTLASCGSLPCGPYVHNKVVTCVVCSK